MEMIIKHLSNSKNLLFFIFYITVCPLLVSVALTQAIDNIVRAWKTDVYKKKFKSVYFYILGIILSLYFLSLSSM